jgi:hypothetical protein
VTSVGVVTRLTSADRGVDSPDNQALAEQLKDSRIILSQPGNWNMDDEEILSTGLASSFY